MTADLRAPFPWFGGKRRVAGEVWKRFGDVRNYVEPFFGSGAVLLGRPAPFDGVETINDLDGFVCNFWRAVRAAPDAVAEHADRPVNENDLHAVHIRLVQSTDELRSRLEGDHEFYDPQIAGMWVWGVSSWIGGGFCSGRGPWVSSGGMLVRGSGGQGVNRQLPHLGRSQGVNRPAVPATVGWLRQLSDRLRRVRVCSGDWSRVCGQSVACRNGLTGVFLDPPYADTAGRTEGLYRVDSDTVAHGVREWAIANGSDSRLRIALCGYEGEHDMPTSWDVYSWSAVGGYGSQSATGNGNRHRERVWFSPSCLSGGQLGLF